MIRIVYITDAFAVWGGLERVLADKMNYLVEQYNYDVHLLTINQGTHDIPFFLNSAIGYQDLGIGMHRQYGYNGLVRLIIRQKIKRLLKQRMKNVIFNLSPDIVVCVKFDFAGLLLKLKGNIPLIVESHAMCHSEKMDGSGLLRRLHVWSFKRNVSKVETVVSLTEGDADDWRRINSNVFVIPNVVHLSDSHWHASLKDRVVIFVGRFSSQKDIQSLLGVWNLVNEKHPDWQSRIYGDGELKDYYMPIIQGMDANIHVFPPTPAIVEKYFESSILILTSLFEPFGLVLPEAMSCGLPVVAFDCPYGPADIITDGVDGFLIQNRNVEAFADKVCQLIDDEALRKKMGEAGVLSSMRYSPDRIMPQWKTLFDNLVNSLQPKDI
jgi:glycosyltransferase involved in cell wall biosynthesis